MPIYTTTDRNVCEIVSHGLVASGGSNSRFSISTWNFRRTAIVNPVNESNIEAAFQAAIGIPLTNVLNNRYVQTSTACRIINDATRLGSLTTRAVAGAVAGDSMPMDGTLYFMMNCAIRGKGVRGSKHLFPMSESQTTAGTSDIWNAGALTLFGLLTAAVLTGFTDSDGNVWKPTLVHRRVSQLKKNPTVVNVDDIVQILINKRVAKMVHRYVSSVY